MRRRAALVQSLRRLLKFFQTEIIDGVVTELEYWQWVSDPEKPTWCAMAIRNVHGNEVGPTAKARPNPQNEIARASPRTDRETPETDQNCHELSGNEFVFR